MEWLKEILKESVEESKVESVINGIKKEIPKHFIIKSEFNAKNEELKATKVKMEELNVQLQEISKDTEESEVLKTKLDNLTKEYDNFKLDSDNRVVEIQKKQAIERGLRNSKANPDTIDLLINQFKINEIQLDNKGDIVDWDTHINPLKENRKSLFESSTLVGEEPQSGNNPQVSSYTNKFNEAIKQGRRLEAIKIKQKAFTEGEII